MAFLEDGVTLQLHWQDTAMLATASRVDVQAYPEHAVFRHPGWPALFVCKKLESWWVAYWLPSQIRVPLVVISVSQLQETIM